MMNDSVSNLPLNSHEIKCDKKVLQGHLELEVSHIHFITVTNVESEANGRKPENNFYVKKIGQIETERNSVDTPLRNINIKNRKGLKVSKNSEVLCAVQRKEGNCNKKFQDSVNVKIILCEIYAENSANCKSINCELRQKYQSINFKLKTSKNYQHLEKHEYKHKHQKAERWLLSANNKLRYRIYTSGALFLEQLCSYKPNETIVASSDNYLTKAKPLGQTCLCLPFILLRKFAHNIGEGHNFEYKTKVYTLCKQNKKLSEKTLEKSSEIKLRFKMLFAPTAAAAATAAVAAKHANIVIHEKRLNSSPLHSHRHHHHHHHHLGAMPTMVQEDVKGDIHRRLSSQTKSEDIVEAMKKLDAKLVAYLAGETEISSKFANCKEEEREANLNLKENNNNIFNSLADLLPAAKLDIFKTINGIKLEMEALTLQPDGTKCMNLMQSEIEPIFTVECQLSNELIKEVPRYDMFHIMQFESEKFQSLTQCTRFGQCAQRTVKLVLNEELSDENANETQLNFGRIHFTVWWREPGTCLNEMLGMGVLELNDLYNASLLEQCKRIDITRRGKHLACLYFKITLQRELKGTQQRPVQMKRELYLPKQNSSDSDSEKSPAACDKNKTPINQQQATQCGSDQSNTNTNNIVSTDKGEYADNLLYLENSKLQ